MQLIPKHGKKNLLQAFFIFIAFLLGSTILNKIDSKSNWPLVLLLSATTAFLYFIIKENIYKNQKSLLQRITQSEKATESWSSIYQFLQFKFPLQTFSNFAISPDFATVILRTILETKPSQIVELGCGSSTIIIGQCLAQYHVTGKLTSIEADEKYLELCSYEIELHKLSPFVQQIFAPYETVEFNETNSIWYQINYSQISEIDLLIIDGPPESLTKNSRLPAIYMFQKYLKVGSIILIDDASRPDMQRVLSAWKKDFPNNHFQEIYSTRGCIKITIK